MSEATLLAPLTMYSVNRDRFDNPANLGSQYFQSLVAPLKILKVGGWTTQDEPSPSSIFECKWQSADPYFTKQVGGWLTYHPPRTSGETSIIPRYLSKG